MDLPSDTALFAYGGSEKTGRDLKDMGGFLKRELAAAKIRYSKIRHPERNPETKGSGGFQVQSCRMMRINSCTGLDLLYMRLLPLPEEREGFFLPFPAVSSFSD